MENRKDIKDYEWKYQVSSIGRIRSLERYVFCRWWKLRKIKWGVLKNRYVKWYTMVCLSREDDTKIVHRLVAQAFIPNPDNKPQINHKNWIRDDNRVDNLERCTNKENAIHSFKYLWRKPNWLWRFWKDNPKSKKVNQYSLEWNLIKIWDSIMDIQRELWFSNWNISRCCKWKFEYRYWYKRAYSLKK